MNYLPPPKRCFNHQLFFVAIVLFGISLVFPVIAIAAGTSGADAVEPDPGCMEAWQEFQSKYPAAEIRWGSKMGHPTIVWGFEPVESNGDFIGTMLNFIEENGELFGIQNQPAPDRILTELVNPRAVYHCDHSRMEPLPGLREDEWFEPSCPAGTVIAFDQQIEGIPYRNGSVIGAFDAEGRLIKIAGEYLGHVDVPLTAWIDEEQAKAAVLSYLNALPDEVQFGHGRYGYNFDSGEIVPVWVFRVVTSFEIEGLGHDVTAIVDAEAGSVIDIISNIDSAPGDTYDSAAYGYTLDTQAAIMCNEPAYRWKYIDNSYGTASRRAAFNPDLHIYDAMEDADDCDINILNSNDTSGTTRIFNYKIVTLSPSVINDDGNIIHRHDISTWTAFYNVITELNYYRNVLGFNEDFYQVAPGLAHLTKYPQDHNLTIIVNKDPSTAELCGSLGMPACFRSYGFPHGLTGGNLTPNCISLDPNEEGYFPFYTVDWGEENSLPPLYDHEFESLHPTMVIGSTASTWSYYNGTWYDDLIRHTALYHEFTHYVQKAYATQTEYWGHTYQFNAHEESVFKEGFAKYFGASMENASPENFDLTNLVCESDDGLFVYQPTFRCCPDVYDRGSIVSQVFWDIRNGWGSTEKGLGKIYTDQLAYQVIKEIALTDVNTMTEMYVTTYAIAMNELDGLCPIGTTLDCVNVIIDAFERHGVCVGILCTYPSWNCANCATGTCTSCTGVRCPSLRPATGACVGVLTTSFEQTAACAPATLAPICCGDDGTSRANVCDTNAALISCGIFSSASQCEDTCAQNLWSQIYRDCLQDHITYPYCKCCGLACDYLYGHDCWASLGYSTKLQCVLDCNNNWNHEDIRCRLNDLRYPDSCDVCD
ncbi:MAG: hypothetical protein GX444_06040 [Myxococcales bacterium]|nr:hypothetical protein [Myxococcales bacterium]